LLQPSHALIAPGLLHDASLECFNAHVQAMPLREQRSQGEQQWLGDGRVPGVDLGNQRPEAALALAGNDAQLSQ
jgi:hypothetical protein